jgi:hypothetical protein
MRRLLQRSYFVADRISVTAWAVLPPRTAPEWILRPRATPLEEATPQSVLDAQTRAEMMLAQMLERMRGEDRPDLFAPSRLDQMAAKLRRAIESGEEPLREALCGALHDSELCRALWRHHARDRRRPSEEELRALHEVLRELQQGAKARAVGGTQ